MSAAATTNKKKNHKDCLKEPESSKNACKVDPPDGAAVGVDAASLPSKARGGAAKSRRRLARGPRSGDLLHTNTPPSAGSAAACPNGAPPHPAPPPPSSSEDHRVVSTHFHDGATQAVLKVTILAAGFVIGARGISARLIGQVTGAVVHSWTERTSSACRPSPPDAPPPPPPVRLFRIEGKRASVQAAVALIQEAVLKYKELCECKRRGEFVQREHLIGGVEFYYHPPPRKVLAPHSTPLPSVRKLSPPMPPPPPPSCASSNTSLISGSPAHPHAWNNIAPRLPSPPRPPPPPPPHGPSTQPFLLNWRLQPPSPPPLPENLIGSGPAPPLPPPHLLPNFRPTPPLPIGLLNAGGSTGSCMASIEQSLHRVRLESSKPFSGPSTTQQNKAKMAELIPPPPLHHSLHQQPPQRQQVQQYCSLFSVFGNGGHPVPIAQAAIALADAGGSTTPHNRSTTTGASPAPQANSSSHPMQTAATAFEFTACDFLRESLPLPAFVGASKRHLGNAPAAAAPLRPSLCMTTPAAAAVPPPEYCLFEAAQQRCPNSAGPLLMPPPPQLNGDLSQWPPLRRSSVHEHRSSKASGC